MKDALALALGRSFLGAAILASGVLQLVIADFVRLVPRPTSGLPYSPAAAYAVGVVLIGIGACILAGRMAASAATLFAALLVVDVLFFYLPQMISNPVVDRPFFRGFMWTNPLKCLALIGGAALVARGWPDGPWPGAAPSRAFAAFSGTSHILLSLFLFVCGVQHFVYEAFVATLVPAWIPPGQLFWGYAAGVALIAGGLGLLVLPVARLAALLSALMIFLWVLLLHIPRAITEANHANETAGVFEALALTGVALLVGASFSKAR
jgi:uncharacterized membrane protein